jgi:hypothetical protein
MTSVVVFWVFLAAVAAWGSAYFAMRDPRSTSWMKIAFVAVSLFLFGFLLMVAGLHRQIDVGEGLLARHGIIFLGNGDDRRAALPRVVDRNALWNVPRSESLVRAWQL